VPPTISGLYLAKAAGVFGAIMAIAFVNLRAHHPYPTFGAANQVTAARALLVACVAALIGELATPQAAWTAIALSLIATLLDGVDGWLARRTRMSSAFGARFDMEVDALLIQVLALLAWGHGKAGAWVVLSGLLRYIFVAAGWIWPWMTRPLAPNFRRKAICVVQIVALLVALVPSIEPPTSSRIAAIGLAILFYSFSIDTLWLWRRR